MANEDSKAEVKVPEVKLPVNEGDPTAEATAPSPAPAQAEINWADGWDEVQTDYEKKDSYTVGTWVTISKKGAVQAVVESSDLIQQVALSRGLTMEQFVFRLNVNQKMKQISATPVPLSMAGNGTTAVHWRKDKGSPLATWHIGGVFKQYPKLRLTGQIRCLVTTAKGPDGLPVLILPLTAGTTVKTGSRSGGTSQSQNQNQSPGSQAAVGNEPDGEIEET